MKRTVRQAKGKETNTRFCSRRYRSVNVKISEGTREKVQAYEGVVIGRSGSGINESFTVKRFHTVKELKEFFPVYSPTIESISVVKR
ncbi:MAG: hypothetical protein CM15mP73_1360 [Hyphomicrobiales bacterium]|nr:MAG: hypothetical protein CM15mP73_1360 [Hyphomicrobiales bacterium]